LNKFIWWCITAILSILLFCALATLHPAGYVFVWDGLEKIGFVSSESDHAMRTALGTQLAVRLSIIVFTVIAFFSLDSWERADSLMKELKNTSAELKRIADLFEDGQRIIFANGESKDISVIGVRPISSGPKNVPDPTAIGSDSKWNETLHVLNWPRPQDLLMSPEYIEYLFNVQLRSTCQKRILVLPDTHTNLVAVRPFVRLLEKLGTKVFVFKKGEFYEMIGAIRQSKKFSKPITKDGLRLEDILVGQPNLCVANNIPVKAQYLKSPTVIDDVECANEQQLFTAMFALLNHACDGEREGLNGLEKVFDSTSPKGAPWSREKVMPLLEKL
jgi:hypothetical protein